MEGRNTREDETLNEDVIQDEREVPYDDVGEVSDLENGKEEGTIDIRDVTGEELREGGKR